MCRSNLGRTGQLLILILSAVVVGAGCAPKTAVSGYPEAGLLLQYRPADGETLRYRSATESTQTLEIKGRAVDVKAGDSAVFSVTPRGREGDSYRLEVVIDSMHMQITSPQGELAPDLEDVVGRSFVMSLSPLGREHDLSEAEAIQYEVGPEGKRSIVSRFQTLFPDVPAGRLELGGTWTTRDTIREIGEGVELSILMESQNTLAGLEVVDGLDCARIEAPFTGTLEGEGQQMGAAFVYDGEVQGSETWYFAHGEGYLVKVATEGTADGTLTISEPEEMTIPMKRDFKVETALIR
jgi:hypothetical protein